MEFVTMVVCAVIALGAFVQGLTGFGLALVSVPLLSLVIDVKLAVPCRRCFRLAGDVAHGVEAATAM